jgi:lipoyl(octanoyl) transferase
VKPRIRVFRPGLLRYDDAHTLQVRLQAARIRGLVPDTLLLLEHPPVITLGRGAKEEHLRFPRENLRARGVDVHEVGRGGDVTYHGPGQMVAYPILELPPGRQDVRRYVKELEESMILLASDYGLTAERIQGFNGTWLRSAELGDRKLGAIGVRISRWVTMHGLALNVSTNLAHFALIVPCGIAGKSVTSLEMELEREVPMREVMDRFEARFASVFDAELEAFEGDPLAGVTDAELDLATLSA